MKMWRGAVAALLLAAAVPAVAQVPYVTITPGPGFEIVAPATHIPVALLVPPGGLSQPEDLCIDGQGRLWIADTGAGRLVSWDPVSGAWRTVGAGNLEGPTGVYVAGSGTIYAADFAAQKVVVFRPDGSVQASWGRPSSPLFGALTPYRPRKIAADGLGTMSIVSEGSQAGIAQLSAAGEFLGFTGVNPTRLTIRAILERLLFTAAQKSQLAKNLPPSPDNIAIDADGLLYTATRGVRQEAIRKLNVAGANLLTERDFFFRDYTDITVDDIGDIYGVNEGGVIVEFDATGQWLFAFGNGDTAGTRVGLVRGASGIAVTPDGTLYVLDKERGAVLVFQPTAFFRTVHTGLQLYKEGRYAESRTTWQEALLLSDSFRLAHKAIGQAAFKQQRYGEALAEFQYSRYASGWSQAFWELRNTWLQSHLGTLLAIVLAFSAAVAVLRRVDRRFGIFLPVRTGVAALGRVKILADLSFAGAFLRHPVNSFYSLRREGRGSALAAVILVLGLVVVRLGGLFSRPFLFDGVDLQHFSLLNELAILLVPLAVWVVANYLVAAISGGEGRLRDVFAGSVYALAPWLLFTIPLALLSRGLTLNEAFIVTLGRQVLLAWAGVNLFLMVKEVHNFGVWQTIANILLTLFAMVILALAAVVIYVLADQVRDFVYAIVQEVRIRVR
jgi:sugar lactone lactonase YvrE